MRTCTKLALTGVMAFGVATSVTAEERLLARTERGLRAVSAALEVAGEPGLLSLQADTAQAVYREARRALNNSQFRDAARLFAQLLKTAGTVSGVITSLDPELNLLELLQPKLKKALRAQLSPAHMRRVTSRWS